MAQTRKKPIKESVKAKKAFACYIELGSSRSLALVAARLPAHLSQIKRWSTDFGWVERVGLYEADCASQRQAKLQKDEMAESLMWAERAKVVRESQYVQAMLLIEKTRGLLALPLATISATKTTEDGKTMHTTTINPVKIPLDALSRASERAHRQAAEACRNDGAIHDADSDRRDEQWIDEDYTLAAEGPE